MAILIFSLVFVGCVAVLALVGLVLVNRRVAVMRRKLLLLNRAGSGNDLLTVISSHIEATRHIDAHTALLDERLRECRDAVSYSIQKVGLVRYDAFSEMSGHLSFSLALLDEVGNGLVLSSINNRSDSRSYAKSVTAGAPDDSPLSNEERAAIDMAFDSQNEEEGAFVDVRSPAGPSLQASDQVSDQAPDQASDQTRALGSSRERVRVQNEDRIVVRP